MFSSGLCPFNRLFWVLPRPGAGKVGVLPGFSTSRVPRPLILFGKRAVQCWFSFLRWGLGQFSYWLVFADLILANQNIRQQKLPIPFFYHYYRPGQAKAGIKEISTLSRLLWLTFMLTVYLKMSSTGLFELWESGENQGSFEAGVGQALSWTTLSAGKHSDFQLLERLVAGAIPVSLPPIELGDSITLRLLFSILEGERIRHSSTAGQIAFNGDERRGNACTVNIFFLLTRSALYTRYIS